jgi:hypothetical protein
VAAPDRTKFFAGDRVADQDRAIELKVVDYCQHIIAQAVGVVVLVCRSGFAGGSKTAPCNGVDVILSVNFTANLS